MTHRIRTIVLDLGPVLVVCAIAACQMFPPTMLVADDVDRIVVNSGGGFQLEGYTNPPQTRIIENRDRIAQIRAVLAAHNWGWHQIMDTPPNTIHAVAFERDQVALLSFSLGRDWMGEYKGGVYKQRRLNDQESKKLYELLGITASDE